MAETITIDVDDEIPLPLRDVLAGRGFITGKSGSGKSTTASVIAEEILDRGRPILIVDTDGEYWGLKEQYEMLHVGAGDDVDHQVGPEHAEWLAEKALVDGIPVILDVSEYLDSDERDQLIRDVAEHLFRLEKDQQTPFLMVVEEIHEYVAQTGSLGDVGEMLVRVAKRGRKRGLGICGISQRPANVDKDFISQADWVFWHRLTWNNDTKVVRDVVGPDTAEVVDGLDDGEAFLTADFLDKRVIRLRVREKRTFDAAETPDLEGFERPDLKGIGEDLSAELDEISQRQQERQDEIERLQSVIDRKDEQIAELEDELEKERIATSTAERIADAIAGGAGDPEVVQEEIEEIREEKNEEIRRLQSERDDLQSRISDLESERSDLLGRVDELETKAQVAANIDELEEAVVRMGAALDLEPIETGDGEVRERLQEKDERISELERELREARARQGDGVDLGEFEEYMDFLEAEPVAEAIEDAKEDDRSVNRYVSGLLAAIIDEGGPVTYREVADRVGINDESNISTKGATPLEHRGVVEREKRSDGTTVVDLNIGGIEEIIRKREKQERTEELMEQL